MGANARSTVGTATDAYALLRLLFSRISEPHVGTSGHFSFNLPDGMCPACEGTGHVSAVDVDGLVDRSLSLNEGAITVPNFTIGSWYWKAYAESDRLDPDKPLRDYSDEEWQWFMHQPATKSTLGGMNTTYEGLLVKVRRVFIDKQAELQAGPRQGVRRADRDVHGLRGVRRQPAQRGGPHGIRPRPHDPRVLGHAGQRPPARGSRRCDDPRSPRSSPTSPRCCARSSRSAWATSPSTASRARCRAARPSGSRWSGTWAARSPTSPTSSTSRRSASTRTTSHG